MKTLVLLSALILLAYQVQTDPIQNTDEETNTEEQPGEFQLGLQDATSPIIEELINFHDHTLIIVFLISSLVLYIISLILTTKLTHTSTIDAQEVETI